MRRNDRYSGGADGHQKLTGRPVKLRLDRDDDMVMTGKRHDFLADYEVGFDDEGRIIEALDSTLCLALRHSADLSDSVNDRAMFHADNCYYLDQVRITVAPLQDPHGLQHRVPRLRRAPGHDDDRAGGSKMPRAWGKDPLDVRKLNLYGGPGRDVTPYHMTVEDNIAGELVEELESHSSDYWRAAPGDRRVQRDEPGDQARAGADPGQVRHLLHRHLPEPGRRAGARLQRRLPCT